MALFWRNIFPTFAVQHYSGVDFRFAGWLQYHYVTAIRKFATLE
jgi:hypothetical protein